MEAAARLAISTTPTKPRDGREQPRRHDALAQHEDRDRRPQNAR
jgi:hypothetical protein